MTSAAGRPHDPLRGACGRLSRSCLPLLLVALALVPATPVAAAQGACLPDATGTEVRVSAVVDGDTLRLSDGELLRLIGLDAPEVGRDGLAHQPYALAATDALAAALPPHGRIRLHQGARARDAHGRLLGYASSDGVSLGDELLRNGLARAVVVPPEVAQAACLFALEDAARARGQGLWRDPVPSYDGRERGFVLLRGRITRAEPQDDGRWFGELEGGLWLTIHADALDAYPELADFQVGDEVEVRGWLSSPRGRRTRLVLRHPSQLRVPPL